MYDNSIPKKSLGQHWLQDGPTLNKIVSLAEIDKASDTILEIGPGQGSLTRLLTKAAFRVIAVELDNNLSEKLMSALNASNLEVVNTSILSFDLTNLPAGYKVVANIPYYLTSNLIRVLSESSNPPSQMVLLIQKEVAERLAAGPGSLSILGITAQYFWEIELDDIVPAKLFTPSPKVDSQVIVLKRHAKPLFSDVDYKKFFRLVKIGFSAKRKTLENSMASGLRLDKGTVEKILIEARIDLKVRAQNLSMDDWYQLYKICLAEKLI